MAWRTGEPGGGANVVTRPSEVGLDLAVGERRALALSLSHHQQESVGVASLTGAPVLSTVLLHHLLQLQSVQPVLVRAGGGPAAGDVVPGDVVPAPLGGSAGPPEDAVQDEPGPGADHHLPPSSHCLATPSPSPLYPGRETLWGK